MAHRDVPPRHYRMLDAASIAGTLGQLQRRIGERFPASGLYNVATELVGIAAECDARLARIARPHWPIRFAVAAGVIGLSAILVAAGSKMQISMAVGGVAELAQGIEATIADLVYLGAGIYFLVSLEARVKRRAALAALHELRSLVHIIDMHQLTKDPEQFLSGGPRTASSPQRTMTRFELARYLDYCSELLSLASKLAALHVQHLNDAVVLAAVNDVESLSGNLSAKIWQKIMILDTLVPSANQ